MSPDRSGNAPEIAIAATGGDFAAARRLLTEYYTWAIAEAGVDGTLEEIVPAAAYEVAHLADHYVPPDAYLLLGWVDGQPVGVCGVDRLDAASAELKRMYVRPEARGRGVGSALVERITELAVGMGCRTLRLDTHAGIMRPAIALYRRFGFVPAERCTDIDVDEMVGFALDLTTGRFPQPKNR
jgi:GNAT superfamily N-acetyltransferase